MLATSMTLAEVGCWTGVAISALLPRHTGEGREGASDGRDARQFLICNLMHLGWGSPPPCLPRMTGEVKEFGVCLPSCLPPLAGEGGAKRRKGVFFSSP